MNPLEEARMIARLAEAGISTNEPIPAHDITFTEACEFLRTDLKKQDQEQKFWRWMRIGRFYGGVSMACVMLILGMHWLLTVALVGMVIVIDIADKEDSK